MANHIPRKNAIAIGNFDGFHRGHKKLISELKKVARQETLCSVILTFDPNPKLYLKLEKNFIHTSIQKQYFLDQQGTDRVSILDFKQIADLEAENFVSECLVKKLNIGYLVVGENFKCGKNRVGNVNFLKQAGSRLGFGTKIISSEMLDGERISSTRIRAQLALGNIKQANHLLGHQYSIWGTIAKGDMIGRQLGFPTINILSENQILPSGIFRTRVEIDARTYLSATYIGSRPTFQGQDKRIESHILDFSGELYGKDVKLFFEEKIRDDKKFNSRQALIQQIMRDIDLVKVDKGQVF